MGIRFIFIKVSIFSYLGFKYHYLGMGAIENVPIEFPNIKTGCDIDVKGALCPGPESIKFSNSCLPAHYWPTLWH